MEYFLERKIDKKRPKKMPKWKWHEQLKKEETHKRELAQKKEEELSGLNKFSKEEKKKELRRAPVTFLTNSFIAFFILGPIMIGILLFIAGVPYLALIICLVAIVSLVWALHKNIPMK